MTDITATLRLESPDLALTEAVRHDETAKVRPVASSGTVPNPEGHLFTVHSKDFDRFEAGLARDHTIAEFDRVTTIDAEAIYRFTYDSGAVVCSAAIAETGGVSLEWSNDGATWTVRVWLPARRALVGLHEWAASRKVGFELQQVHTHTTPVETGYGLTDDQRKALLLALEMGYFTEPREATAR
jgi:predicted DNA binding protein